MAKRKTPDLAEYGGFFQVPNRWHTTMAGRTLAEREVVLYIMRHTWGFDQVEKKITLDEFSHGRKRKDGTRLDGGTGLAKSTVQKALALALQHGFVKVRLDDSDGGRRQRYYRLTKKVLGENKNHSDGRESVPCLIQMADSRYPHGRESVPTWTRIGHRTGTDTSVQKRKKETHGELPVPESSFLHSFGDSNGKDSHRKGITNLSKYDLTQGKTLKKILTHHGKQLGEKTNAKTFAQSVNSLRLKVKEKRITKVIEYLVKTYNNRFTPKLHKANDLYTRFDQFEEASLRYYEDQSGEYCQDSWKTRHSLMVKVRTKMLENGDFEFDWNGHDQKQVDCALKQLGMLPGVVKAHEVM